MKNVDIPKEKIVDFCKRHYIWRLAIFGSALGKDFGPESDVDILVKFEEGHKPTLFELVGMQGELEEIFSRPVDLRTKEDLSRYFREKVEEESEEIYAA